MPRIIKKPDHYWVSFRRDDIRHRRRFSFEKYGGQAEALVAAQAFMDSIFRHRTMPEPYRLDDQITEYLRAIDSRKRYSTIRSEQYRLRVFSEWAQESTRIRAAADITLATVRQFQDFILRGGHRYKDNRRRRAGSRMQTWRNYQYGLSAFLWWAVGRGLIKENPIAGARELRVRESGTVVGRALSSDEIAQVLRFYEDPIVRAMFGLLLYTGCRTGEAMALTWRYVDLKDRTIKYISTKTHQDRVVPIKEELLTLLKEIPQRRADDLVISNEAGHRYYAHNWWYRLLNRALEESGFRRARLHDLRVTFVTTLINNGANPYTVSKLVGHSTIRVTERYTRISDRAKDDALEFLDY